MTDTPDEDDLKARTKRWYPEDRPKEVKQPRDLLRIIRKVANPGTSAHGFIDLGPFMLPFHETEPSIDGSHIHVWLGIHDGLDALLLQIAEIAIQHTQLHVMTWCGGLPNGFHSHRLLKKRD